MDLFFEYYGLDWASVILGLGGTYLLGERNRLGFLMVIVSLTCAASVAVLAETYAFLFSNIPSMYLNASGYMKWKQATALSQKVSTVPAQTEIGLTLR